MSLNDDHTKILVKDDTLVIETIQYFVQMLIKLISHKN